DAAVLDRGMRIHLTTAGDRVYMWGARVRNTLVAALTLFVRPPAWPMIIYHEHGGAAGWTDANGGYDPLFDDPAAATSDEGRIAALSVVEGKDGGYEGWAARSFGDDS